MAAADPGLMVCDARALGKPDAATIQALAYAALTARRLGCSVVLVNCPPALAELIELCGLAGVLPTRLPRCRRRAARRLRRAVRCRQCRTGRSPPR